MKMKAAFALRGAIQDQGIRHIYGRVDATSGVVVGSGVPDDGDGSTGIYWRPVVVWVNARDIEMKRI
jgi:hypothetical protein